jgi:hypothetical protein
VIFEKKFCQKMTKWLFLEHPIFMAKTTIYLDEESSSHQGKNCYRPEIALKHALEKWLNHFNHGPGPAIPPYVFSNFYTITKALLELAKWKPKQRLPS